MVLTELLITDILMFIAWRTMDASPISCKLQMTISFHFLLEVDFYKSRTIVLRGCKLYLIVERYDCYETIRLLLRSNFTKSVK